MSSDKRPLGGISALYLCTASLSEAVLKEAPHEHKIEIMEDSSTYAETTNMAYSTPRITHSLTIVTELDTTLDKIVKEGNTTGFVAWIEGNSGHLIKVGESKLAGLDRPLRLESCTTTIGEKPASRPFKRWVFKSVDSESAITE